MARFNFDAVPTVTPEGAPGNDYQRINASPAMFGGLIAGAEEKAGGALEGSANSGLGYLEARQQLTNEIYVSQNNTDFAKKLTDRSNAFMQLQGRAAQDGLPQYKQDVDDLYKQSIDAAGNNLQVKAQLSKANRFLTDSYYRYATNHADTQWRTWQTKTSEDRANEFGNQAAVAAQHGTWDEVGGFLGVSDDEVRKNGEAQGLDTDSINSLVAKRRGQNVKNIVETLADTDPHTAQAVFDKYKDGMDAGSVLAVTSKLRGINAQLSGRQIADEETGRTPRGAPPAPIADMPASFVSALKREEGFDPVPRWDVKQWTVGYGTKATGPDERPNEAELDQRFNKAVTDAAKTVDSVNPDLDPGTRAALISLTHNTGDAWTHSGLGDQIRKGDIAGAQQTFLQYANVAGQPNQQIAERRWREAQWFGQADAPAGGPAPDKAAVFDRIAARTANDPLAQSAAIARMNQIYAVERATDTQNKVLFEQQVKDTTSEAYNTGAVKTPLTENDFVQNLGFAPGRAQYADYKQNLELGADVAAAASMSPQDRVALMARYVPQPGQAGFAQQVERMGKLQAALTLLDKERDQDPAGFAVSRLPDAKGAYQGMLQVEQDPKATDDQKKAARANYAAVMQREQTRIGVDPADQGLLSRDAVTAMNNKLASAADSDDPQARTGLVAQVQREAKLWGDNWPAVMRQLAPQAQPVVNAIAAGADPVAMTRLLAADPKQKPTAVLKEQNEVKAQDLNKSIETAMAPFRSTLVGRQVDRDYSTYYNLATQLGALYVRDGMSASDAANKAFGDLIGNRYDFRDSWRIPKSSGVATDDVQAGTLVARNNIASGAIAVQPAIDDMALGANNAADSMNKFARDGRFVTSEKNDGLYLAYGDKFVRGADGKPLKLTWQQLAQLGGTAAGRQAEGNQVRQENPAAFGAY